MTEDRAVSITVTHVMTVGITTILIAGLMLGAGNMLEDQRTSTGDRELRSIGDRTATELVTAADRGNRTSSNVQIRSQQPGSSIGGGYQVTLTDRSDCFADTGYDGCLELDASAENIGVEVPVSVPAGITVENGTADSGDVVAVYNNSEATVTIRGGQP